MKISDEIKGLLAEETDLSIVQFAATAGVHTQTVYNAINEKNLKPKSVNKLAKALRSFKSKAVS